MILDDLTAARAPAIIQRPGELGVPVTDQERPCPCPLAEADDQMPRLLGHPKTGRMVSDTSKVHPPAAELDEQQHVHPPQEDRVDGEERRTPRSQQPAGARTIASAMGHAAAPGQDRGRAAPAGSSWATPERQAATVRRAGAGNPTVGSRGPAARPVAAPPRRWEVGRWGLVR